MRRQPLVPLRSIATMLAVVTIASVSIAGQGATGTAKTTAASKSWTPPRTPWGDPDLQGTWNR